MLLTIKHYNMLLGINIAQFGFIWATIIVLIILGSWYLKKYADKKEYEARDKEIPDESIEYWLGVAFKADYLEEAYKSLDKLLKWHKKILPRTPDAKEAENKIYATKRYLRNLILQVSNHPANVKITEEVWARFVKDANMLSNLPIPPERNYTQEDIDKTYAKFMEEVEEMYKSGHISKKEYDDFKSDQTGRSHGLGGPPQWNNQ